MTVCVHGGNHCFGLPLPEADVTVTTASGRLVASGKTNESGMATFKVHDFGTLGVVVRSPLLEDGEKTGAVPS